MEQAQDALRSGAGQMPPDRHAMLHAIFVTMDADKSDYVDAEEFKSIFSDATEKHSDERMAEIDGMRDRGDSDGHLSANEFCDFMIEYLAELSDKAFRERIASWHELLASSHRKLLLRRVFARMDVDKSGAVSLQEFKALGEDDVGADSSDAFFRWIEGATGNNDGQLTSDEWVAFVLECEAGSSDEAFQDIVDEWMEVLERKRRSTMLKQVFYKMDADCSGSVDVSEFNNLAEGDGDDGALHMIYHYLDQQFGNGDGMIQLDEWLQGMRKMAEDMSDADFETEVANWNRVLTANQRKLWQGCYSRGHANSFVIASRAAGATHALFVAHGHTEAGPPVAFATGDPSQVDLAQVAEEKAVDMTLSLTDRGSAQCMVARDEWFGRLPVRKSILSSPAKRCTETALHMLGQPQLRGAPADEQPTLLVEKLHPIGQSVMCEELVRQRGCGPLRTLLDAEGGETAFGLYAETTCEEIAAKFREENEKPTADGQRERATYVSLVGHAGFLNAVAYAVSTAAGIEGDSLEATLDIDLGEAEGILVPLYGKGKSVIHLKRPL